MKKTLILLLVASTLIACSGKKATKGGDTIPKNGTVHNQTQALIQRYKAIIGGIWINKDYIDEIVRTKSPQKAYEKVGEITEMPIEAAHIKGDSILFYYNSSNHEAIKAAIRLRPGTSPKTIIGPGNSDLQINEAGNILTLSTTDKENSRRETTVFFKASKEETDKGEGDALKYIINKMLVIGDYTLRDSSNKVSKVSFKDDGKVVGLGDFKTYNILIDFMTPPNNLDQIFFDSNTPPSKYFAFKISADTLSLFETKDGADSVNLELSKLKYKLVRQK